VASLSVVLWPPASALRAWRGGGPRKDTTPAHELSFFGRPVPLAGNHRAGRADHTTDGNLKRKLLRIQDAIRILNNQLILLDVVLCIAALERTSKQDCKL
jgi:hypothetical protein